MPIEKLSRADLDRVKGGGLSPEVAAFAAEMRGMKVGDGGKLSCAAEGKSAFVLKKRLTAAAEAAGVNIAFVPRTGDDVVFEVVEHAVVRKPRRVRLSDTGGGG